MRPAIPSCVPRFRHLRPNVSIMLESFDFNYSSDAEFYCFCSLLRFYCSCLGREQARRPMYIHFSPSNGQSSLSDIARRLKIRMTWREFKSRNCRQMYVVFQYPLKSCLLFAVCVRIFTVTYTCTGNHSHSVLVARWYDSVNEPVDLATSWNQESSVSTCVTFVNCHRVQISNIQLTATVFLLDCY